MTATVICKSCRRIQPTPTAYALDHGYCDYCGASFRCGDNLDQSGPYHTAESYDWGCTCGSANSYRNHTCPSCAQPAPFTLPNTPGSNLRGVDTDQALAAWLNATDYGGNTEQNPWEALDDAFGNVYDMAVLFEQPQSPEHVNGLLGYFFTGPFAGEYYPDNTPSMGNRLFVPYVDDTKSRRDDVGDAWAEFRAYVEQGTPVRKTDRTGAGTKGTRKWAGIQGRYWVAVR